MGHKELGLQNGGKLALQVWETVEIVTLDSDSEDETLEEMEAELVRMIERRLGRKRSHQGKYNAFWLSSNFYLISAVLNKTFSSESAKI